MAKIILKGALNIPFELKANVADDLLTKWSMTEDDRQREVAKRIKKDYIPNAHLLERLLEKTKKELRDLFGNNCKTLNGDMELTGYDTIKKTCPACNFTPKDQKEYYCSKCGTELQE
ncbi:hypothetical protein KAJ61_04360 [Candidatus Parcubacteria bacterium]|nr:hypothetical protein [Candidatus Parcubacteria bacterium]